MGILSPHSLTLRREERRDSPTQFAHRAAEEIPEKVGCHNRQSFPAKAALFLPATVSRATRSDSAQVAPTSPPFCHPSVVTKVKSPTSPSFSYSSALTESESSPTSRHTSILPAGLAASAAAQSAATQHPSFSFAVFCDRPGGDFGPGHDAEDAVGAVEAASERGVTEEGERHGKAATERRVRQPGVGDSRV